MRQDEIARSLRRLLDELALVRGAETADAQHLEEVRAGIQGFLDDAESVTSASFARRTARLIHRFEDDHPRLALAVNQASDVLARMGL